MHKFLAIAVVACGASLTTAAQPAWAQRGNFRGGVPMNTGGLRYYGYQPFNGGYDWRNFYGYTYPYNTARQTVGGQSPDDYDYNDLDATAVPNRQMNYSPELAGPSYGADVYAALRSRSRSVAPVNQAATVAVRLPDSAAQVFFDNSPTRQGGTERVYTTPALAAGKTYTYTIRATWVQNGTPVEQSREVNVQAGREAAVDFR